MKPISRRMKQVNREKEGQKIDVSLLRQPIKLGGSALEQILNGVHYGTPEMRSLLQHECNFIFECKLCRALFRDLPNFISHKRGFCEKSAQYQEWLELLNAAGDEVALVEPEPPEETRSEASACSSSVSTSVQDLPDKSAPETDNRQSLCDSSKDERPSAPLDSDRGDTVLCEQDLEKSTLCLPAEKHVEESLSLAGHQSSFVPAKEQQQLEQPQNQRVDPSSSTGVRLSLEDAVQRIHEQKLSKPSALRLYTEAACKLQRQKDNVRVTTVAATPIPTNSNAVFVNIRAGSKNDQDKEQTEKSGKEILQISTGEEYHERLEAEDSLEQRRDKCVSYRKKSIPFSKEARRQGKHKMLKHKSEKQVLSKKEEEKKTWKKDERQGGYKGKEEKEIGNENITLKFREGELQRNKMLEEQRLPKRREDVKKHTLTVEERKQQEKKEEEGSKIQRENLSSATRAPSLQTVRDQDRTSMIGKEFARLIKPRDMYPEPQQILMDQLREMQDKVKQKAAAEGKTEILEISDDESDGAVAKFGSSPAALSPPSRNSSFIEASPCLSKTPNSKGGMYKCRMCTYEAEDKADCTRHILRKHRYAMRHKSASAIRSMSVYQSPAKKQIKVHRSDSKESSKKNSDGLQQEGNNLRDMVRKNLQFALQKAEEVLKTKQSSGSEQQIKPKRSQSKEEEESHPLKCQKCNKIYSSKCSLSFHVSVVHAEQRTYFPCPMCKNVFASLHGVMRHIKTCHGKSSQKVEEMRSLLKKKAFKKPASQLQNSQTAGEKLDMNSKAPITRKRTFQDNTEAAPSKRYKLDSGNEGEEAKKDRPNVKEDESEIGSHLNTIGSDLRAGSKGTSIAESSETEESDLITNIDGESKSKTTVRSGMNKINFIQQRKSTRDLGFGRKHSTGTSLLGDVSPKSSPYTCSKCKRSFGRKISFDNHIEVCGGTKMEITALKSDVKTLYPMKSLAVVTKSDRTPISSASQRSPARKENKETLPKDQVSPVSLLSLSNSAEPQPKHRDSSSDSLRSCRSDMPATGKPKTRMSRSLSADRDTVKRTRARGQFRGTLLKKQVASLTNLNDGVRWRARRSVFSKYAKRTAPSLENCTKIPPHSGEPDRSPLSKALGTCRSQEDRKPNTKSKNSPSKAMLSSSSTATSPSPNVKEDSKAKNTCTATRPSPSVKEELKATPRSTLSSVTFSVQTRHAKSLSKPEIASTDQRRQSLALPGKPVVSGRSLRKEALIVELNRAGCVKKTNQPRDKDDTAKTLETGKTDAGTPLNRFHGKKPQRSDNEDKPSVSLKSDVSLQSGDFKVASPSKVRANTNSRSSTMECESALSSGNDIDTLSNDKEDVVTVEASMTRPSPNREIESSLEKHGPEQDTWANGDPELCHAELSRKTPDAGAIGKLMDVLRHSFVKKTTTRGRQLDDTGLELTESKEEFIQLCPAEGSSQVNPRETHQFSNSTCKTHSPGTSDITSGKPSATLKEEKGTNDVPSITVKEENGFLNFENDNDIASDQSGSISLEKSDSLEEENGQSFTKAPEATKIICVQSKTSHVISGSSSMHEPKSGLDNTSEQATQQKEHVPSRNAPNLSDLSLLQQDRCHVTAAGQQEGRLEPSVGILASSSSKLGSSELPDDSAYFPFKGKSGETLASLQTIQENETNAASGNISDSSSSSVRKRPKRAVHSAVSSEHNCESLVSNSAKLTSSAISAHSLARSSQPSTKSKRDLRSRTAKVSERIKEGKRSASPLKLPLRDRFSKRRALIRKSAKHLKRKKRNQKLLESNDIPSPKNASYNEVADDHKDSDKNEDMKATRIKSTANRTYVMRTTAGEEKLECFDKSKIYKFVDKAKTTCLGCGEKYTKMYNLRRHIILNHLKWTRFKCTLCGCETYDRSNCARHIMKAHSNLTQRSNTAINALIVNLTKQGCQARSRKISHSIKKNQESERKQTESIYARPTLSLRRRGRPTLALLSSPSPSKFSEKKSTPTRNKQETKTVVKNQNSVETGKSIASSSSLELLGRPIEVLDSRLANENMSQSFQNEVKKGAASEGKDCLESKEFKSGKQAVSIDGDSKGKAFPQSNYEAQKDGDCQDNRNIFAQLQFETPAQAQTGDVQADASQLKTEQSPSPLKRSKRLEKGAISSSGLRGLQEQALCPSQSKPEPGNTKGLSSSPVLEIASTQLNQSHPEKSSLSPSSSQPTGQSFTRSSPQSLLKAIKLSEVSLKQHFDTSPSLGGPADSHTLAGDGTKVAPSVCDNASSAKDILSAVDEQTNCAACPTPRPHVNIGTASAIPPQSQSMATSISLQSKKSEHSFLALPQSPPQGDVSAGSKELPTSATLTEDTGEKPSS